MPIARIPTKATTAKNAVVTAAVATRRKFPSLSRGGTPPPSAILLRAVPSPALTLSTELERATVSSSHAIATQTVDLRLAVGRNSAPADSTPALVEAARHADTRDAAAAKTSLDAATCSGDPTPWAFAARPALLSSVRHGGTRARASVAGAARQLLVEPPTPVVRFLPGPPRLDDDAAEIVEPETHR